ncbi:MULTISPECIES: glycosyltransferase family 2 protein [Sellimonas]|uniref:Glycosyltransferase family 2 protein n=1 Tax=Sellimonas caecigallum TaxID=2592333 RepID=A0ABS7L473_9FIRM|nr:MULTISPECIES: glycosyltransferase family 2 protein [Sellimonas]MBY0757836.1 glycosyltransferase family 2 protein [Sellimonas caecigallum]OUP02340.1 hypothetical protein B5F37_03850 [Drancourtella sp. An210]OUP64244.1 hypothetical protein B5F13_08190 [Drancourtella sp. An177]
MSKIQVSVIMPVYNSEEYLETAIKSVLDQKMEDMELLLVDDGSKDRSGEICDKYKEDKRVRVFHKENEGICATRNFAVDHAEGEYLVFIDNDDELAADVLEKNYALAKKYDADVVKYGCSIEESFANGYVDKRANVFKKFRVFDREHAAKYYAVAEKERYFSYIWNGMYKKSFWTENHLKFDTSIKCGFEDRVLNYEIFQIAGKQVLNPEIGYKYYQRFEHSTFKKFNRNMLYSCLLSAEAEYELFQHLKSNPDFHSDWIQKSAEYLTEFLMLLSRSDNDMTKSELTDFMRKLRKSKAFRDVQKKGSDKRLSMTKKGVVRLFVKGKYSLLLNVSRVYARFIFLKKRMGKR